VIEWYWSESCRRGLAFDVAIPKPENYWCFSILLLHTKKRD